MTLFQPNDDGHADLTSHDSFTKGPPHATFARLRREDPCHWTDYPAGQGFWSITRYGDILELQKNPARASSARGIRMEDQSYEEYLARRTFQETDPPEHTAVRRKVNRAFSKPVVAQFEDQIRALCARILEPAIARGEFDAVTDIARQLPMLMLGRIMGVPEADLRWLVEKGDALIANTDPEFTEHVLDRMTTDEYRLMPFNSPAGAELYDYAKKLMAEKERRGDTDGVLHLIRQPDEEGKVISEIEFRNFFCLLVAAGNDTTRYSIAAGLYALCHRPQLLALLKSREDGIFETAADEVIRWASPTMYFRRTAGEDFEMHGRQIRKGDKIVLWFVSANRDETVFANPHEPDFRRRPNRHLAFGQGGPHVCLGMWLARLEVRCLLDELSRRIDAIEQTGPHEYLRSNFVGGIKHLPVRVRAA
ncbi:MAG: cytochrome P450 [Alphaproteobacteria bacterium]|nr:MAG: cytochrome P450 [Alphaproteobacteria bacterium]